MAEEVEVGGVEMVRYFETMFLLAGFDPAVFDAGEAFAVDVGGSLCSGLLAEDARVEDGCCDKEHGGGQQPPRRQGVQMEGAPSENQSGYDEEEAQVSDAEMQFFEVRDLRFAGLLAVLVFL